ncbi:dermonecrotic toxin domain-containing protein [Luteibacter yeojuensis]
MDMAPAQAPPAATSIAAPDDAARVRRLDETHRWLKAQQAFLPVIPVHDGASASAPFMDELAGFWRSPVAPYPGRPPMPRAAAFGVRWLEVMADEAALRNAEGHLGNEASDAILAFTGTQGHILPPHLNVRQLMVAAQPYAGVVVLEDTRPQGSLLLFMPDRGWEAFPDLVTLHLEFEERLREALAATARLPGMNDDDLVEMAHIDVTSEPITANIVDTLVGRIVDLQQRRAASAWTWRDERTGHQLRRADRIHEALLSDDYLDVPAILLRRRARIFSSIHDMRLAQVPEHVRDEWRETLADYRRQRADAGRVVKEHGYGGISSIDQYAREQLRPRLLDRGVGDDPADITIELFQTTASTSYGYSGADMQRRTLIDLAKENVGFFDMRGMQARSAAGGFILALGRDDIVDLVRDLDLRNSYQGYLLRALKSSVDGMRTRASSARLQEARMRFELADARATRFIATGADDFIDDHSERGYRWVRAILDAPSPSTRRRVDDHEIVANHLVYEGAKLKDVVVIGVRAKGSVFRTVLYTPDAPDGRSFREFDDRRAVARDFLHNPAFEQYLLERLPAAWSSVDRDGVTRRFRVSMGTRRAVWALSSQRGEQPHTLTEGRFTEEEVTGNLFDASYDVSLGHLGRDAADLARSTGQADYDQALSIGMFTVHFAEGFLPVRMGVAIGGARALHASWQGIESIGRDDRAQAFEDFIDAFSSMSDWMGVHPFKRSITRPMFVRVPGQPRMLVATRTKIDGVDNLFDARYLAPGGSLRKARSLANGVYDIDGGQYVERDGQFYGVRFDPENATWRLKKPRHSPADYGPPVVRDADGRWVHNKGIGLRGGMRDRPDLSGKDPLGLLMEYRHLDPQILALSTNDLEVMILALSRRGLHGGVVKRLIHDRMQGWPLSAAMARHWEAALAEAQRPPPRIRVPAPPPSDGFQLVKLERSQWPTTAWHYTTRLWHAMFRGKSITLNQSLPAATGPSGLHVMTMDPGTPSRQIVKIMRGEVRTSNFSDDKVREIAAAYVEIDLNKLRDRQRTDGTFEYNLYTVTNRSGVEFVIKPTLPAPHRGMAPISPTRQRDLAGIMLKPGEFRSALRFP